MCTTVQTPIFYTDIKCSTEGGAGCYPTAALADVLSLLKDRSPPAKAQGTLPSAETEGRERRPGSSQGKLACFYKMHLAVAGAGYLVHSPPLEREQDTLRFRDSSTQHVRGKQFIFLPQLLTGGNIKCH